MKHSVVHICKHFSDSIFIQIDVKQGDALTPVLFIFSLEYVISVQENRVRLKLNGTHKLLAYTNDVNILVDNIDT
jgi:hypothetical protein